MLRFVKKCIIIFICVLMMFSLCYKSFAIEPDDVTGKFKGVLAEGAGQSKNISKNIISSVLSVVRIVAAAIALVILMIIGCKYIIASAGDRADIKKYAVNYVIGAVILFGASGIFGIIQNFVEDVVKL